MAWTPPMTAVANEEFSAAEFNTHIRDNLNETAPAKATIPGGYFVSTGNNAIAERTWDYEVDNTLQTTSSNTYVTLNNGPEVTLTTGTKAIVYMTCQFQAEDDGNFGRASVAVSGATSINAQDEWAIYAQADAGTRFLRFGGQVVFDTLNAGVNTFTMQHETNVTAPTVFSFNRRLLIVEPF